MNIRLPLLSLFLAASNLVANDSFVPRTSMPEARTGADAALLPDGRVLIVGGNSGSPGFTDLATTILYDPTTQLWSPSGNLAHARRSHTATALVDGRVLVTGGGGGGATELFDPSTGTWTATGSRPSHLILHTATRLANGKVLVTGGQSFGLESMTTSAELYDPASGLWSSTGEMDIPRTDHTATLLPDGRVLVAGGYTIVLDGEIPQLTFTAAAELYDPVTGTWSSAGVMSAPRGFHAALLLPNGKVLLAGGTDGHHYLASADLFDPALGTWTLTGSMAAARSDPTLSLLQNGKVLVAGGESSSDPPAFGELYNASTGAWRTVGSMVSPRRFHTATVLTSGRVFLAGGSNDANAVASAEVFIPYVARPTLRILGRRRVRTRRATLPVRCRTAGAVTAVKYRVGNRGPFRRARGSGNGWSFTARLKTGNNPIRAIASGPGGSSAPARVVAVRTRRAR